MPFQANRFVQYFFRIALALLITIFLLRGYEYAVAASKSFTANAYRYELAGLFYDLWLWLIYCAVVFFPALLIAYIKERAGIIFFHVLNIVLLACYIGLLITFSERNTPFDHELFTRNSSDTIDTVKQMLTAGVKPYVPFFIFIPVYFLCCYRLTERIRAPKKLVLFIALLAIIAVSLMRFANPSPDWFQHNGAYYLVSNKLTYWFTDSYDFFREKNRRDNRQDNASVKKAIEYYQQSQPFSFTSSEYPLLHSNTETDVLGSFFNLQKTLPNIVILVVEGLSRDFSGDHAYAGSFTPFLDSLSHKGLTWDNFLSTAPGTFAAHPAIEASLPYGKRGFSVMNVMPDHLSLIKILKSNGYHTKFLVGFNPFAGNGFYFVAV
jgi:hypothetical protein